MRPKVPIQLWLVLTLCSVILTLGSKDMGAVDNATNPPPGLAAPRPATPMPDFSLPNVDGTTVHAADLQGKVILVRFWATW
jgi:hypothetical protein